MTTTPPVLLLGGRENLVSAARALAARRITVVTVADDANPGHSARGATPARIGPAVTTDALAAWFDTNGDAYAGAVIVPLSDPALIFVAERYDSLRRTHRPAALRPDLVTALLDKRTTNDLGRAAGVHVPGQWEIDGPGDLDQITDDLRFPVIVKPRHTFELLAATGRKFLRADDLTELRSAVEQLAELAGGFVINQFIEGPDTQLASYYAIRHDGRTELSFTKRIYRRYRRNEGGATLHELIDLPEVAEIGERLFDHLGIEGLANVEFKQSLIDGEWYLIESNYRITAANELMQRAGIDVIGAVYAQALGEPLPTSWNWDGRPRFYWYPLRDLLSAREGDPGLGLWLKMLVSRPVLPYWNLGDTGPSRQQAMAWVRRNWRQRVRGLSRSEARS